MTLDNMTGITEGSYTGFCKSQLITCNFVKACNGVCPFEDALKHADKMQTMNEKHTVDHDRDWVIGCIEHDGFIHTHRFDKANQIIHDALLAEAEWIPCSERLPEKHEPGQWQTEIRALGQYIAENADRLVDRCDKKTDFTIYFRHEWDGPPTVQITQEEEKK